MPWQKGETTDETPETPKTGAPQTEAPPQQEQPPVKEGTDPSVKTEL